MGQKSLFLIFFLHTAGPDFPKLHLFRILGHYCVKIAAIIHRKTICVYQTTKRKKTYTITILVVVYIVCDLILYKNPTLIKNKKKQKSVRDQWHYYYLFKKERNILLKSTQCLCNLQPINCQFLNLAGYIFRYLCAVYGSSPFVVYIYYM